MNWIGQVVWGFIRGLFGHAQDQAEKPHVITPAATPPAKLQAHQDRIRAYKQKKDHEERDAKH